MDARRKVPTSTAKPSPAGRKRSSAPVEKDDVPTGDSDPLMGLTPREARFVEAYLANGMNAGDAYVAAGFKSKPGRNAWSSASRRLTSDKVRRYLSHRVKSMFRRLEDQQDALMQALTLLAFADMRELSEFHRGACHYCHGKGHRYQYSAGEWDDIMTKHAERAAKAEDAGRAAPALPDPKGGADYEWARDPHPECPECAGLGEGRVIIHDTRHLSPAAVLAFEGVKVNKGGIEVKVQDRMKALEMLAKIAKLYEDSTSVTVNVSAAELDAKYAQTMGAARASMAAMREDRQKLRQENGGLGAGAAQAGALK